MRILFFGRLVEAAGARMMSGPDEATNLMELRAWLETRDRILGEALAGKGVRVSVNKAIVHHENLALKPGDEIAFMPPLSGG